MKLRYDLYKVTLIGSMQVHGKETETVFILLHTRTCLHFVNLH